jgi:phosphatidylserine/phosphatidylglycerophosphate/cardiolipin synthase-like enzyme
MWCVADLNEDYVAKMEDVLETYEQPYDPKQPVVCLDPNCSILSWFEGSGSDTQTFHFKAISADRGTRAYLGSANMTVSSLRSRMELGVVLTGKVAEELDRVLRVVLTLASPISL